MLWPERKEKTFMTVYACISRLTYSFESTKLSVRFWPLWIGYFPDSFFKSLCSQRFLYWFSILFLHWFFSPDFRFYIWRVLFSFDIYILRFCILHFFHFVFFFSFLLSLFILYMSYISFFFLYLFSLFKPNFLFFFIFILAIFFLFQRSFRFSCISSAFIVSFHFFFIFFISLHLSFFHRFLISFRWVLEYSDCIDAVD